MIETRLNKFDKDFIILFSDYLLNGDYNNFYNNMRKLAELGQINAIQQYYLLKPKEVINEKIDSQIKDFHYFSHYNFAMVIANFFYSKEKDKLEKYLSEIKKNTNKISSDKIETENLINNFTTKIKSLDYMHYLLHSITLCNQHYNESNNILYLENALELANIYTTNLYNKYNDIKYLIDRHFKKVRRKLFTYYKLNPNNITIKFYLAKNLHTFKGNEKSKSLCKNILKELSCMRLSNDFLRYNKNYDKTNDNTISVHTLQI